MPADGCVLVQNGGELPAQRVSHGRLKPDPGAVVRHQESRPSAGPGPRSWGGGAPDPEQWIEEWERRTAAAMVKDLENCGADQDLEELRSGWASSKCVRHESAPSQLNRRGDVAARRLRTVDGLRQVAAGVAPIGEVTEASVPGQLRLGDASSSGRPPSGAGGAPPQRSAHDSTKKSGAPRPRRRVGSESPLRAMAEEDDPWASWEARWAETFEQLQGARQTGSRSAGSAAAKAAPSTGFAKASSSNASPKTRSQTGSDYDDSRQRRPHGDAPQGASAPGPSCASGNRAAPPRRPGSGSRPEQNSNDGARRPTAGAKGPAPPPGARGGTPGQESKKQAGYAAPKLPPRSAPQVVHLASFTEFEDAWSVFENRVSVGQDQQVSYADIPWPLGLPTVSGITGGDASGDRKRKLRAALLRWHPDKWAPILNRVRDAEKASVTERVMEVTRRILAEKEQFSQ